MPYALDMIQNRGKLFIAPSEAVYGQIIGENLVKDLPVNPTKAKQLDNMRASGSDKGIQLAPPKNSLWNVPSNTSHQMS